MACRRRWQAAEGTQSARQLLPNALGNNGAVLRCSGRPVSDRGAQPAARPGETVTTTVSAAAIRWVSKAPPVKAH